MTLTEIESVLGELAKRHSNLDQNLLSTLLASAGWDDASIKDALILFAKRGAAIAPSVTPVMQTVSSTPATSANPVTQQEAVDKTSKEQTPITFYQPDGTEEGELKIHQDAPVIQREQVAISKSEATAIEKNAEKSNVAQPPVAPSEKIQEQVAETQVATDHLHEIVAEPFVATPVADPSQQPTSTAEPQSLITPAESPRQAQEQKNVELPGNLPLLPFESSPHVWSFSKYKDVFHSAPQKEEIKIINVMPKKAPSAQTPQPQQQSTSVVIPFPDKEVIVETVPLRKDDKPLVFLASIMLLAIILILGYMYSNGRL